MTKPCKTLFALLILIAILSITCRGATFDEFTEALNKVETGGRKSGKLLGDDGKALGPLQIHRTYFIDSRSGGTYAQCEEYKFSCAVVRRYLERYAPKALRERDWKTCARIHNGGPQGLKKKQTLVYWKKVRKALTH